MTVQDDFDKLIISANRRERFFAITDRVAAVLLFICLAILVLNYIFGEFEVKDLFPFVALSGLYAANKIWDQAFGREVPAKINKNKGENK